MFVESPLVLSQDPRNDVFQLNYQPIKSYPKLPCLLFLTDHPHYTQRGLASPEGRQRCLA